MHNMSNRHLMLFIGIFPFLANLFIQSRGDCHIHRHGNKLNQTRMMGKKITLPSAILLFLTTAALLTGSATGINGPINSPKEFSARFLERQRDLTKDAALLQSNNGIEETKGHGPLQNQLFNQRGAIPLQIDSGGVPFAFGGSYTWAYQSFYFYLPTNAVYAILIWDCYCSGDRFEVYLNGVSKTTTDTGCTSTPGICQPYLSDPNDCFLTAGFCTNNSQSSNNIVGPGFFNATIKVLQSYYGLGVGYLGVYSLDGGAIICDSLMDCSNVN